MAAGCCLSRTSLGDAGGLGNDPFPHRTHMYAHTTTPTDFHTDTRMHAHTTTPIDFHTHIRMCTHTTQHRPRPPGLPGGVHPLQQPLPPRQQQGLLQQLRRRAAPAVVRARVGIIYIYVCVCVMCVICVCVCRGVSGCVGESLCAYMCVFPLLDVSIHHRPFPSLTRTLSPPLHIHSHPSSLSLTHTHFTTLSSIL